LSLTGTEALRTIEKEAADEPTVVELVNRAVSSRDRAAFGELYDRFVERVYRYLYFRTANQAEAEDLTEQVFLKAWEALGKFTWQGRPFLAWLYRLAHNLHVDHLRRGRRSLRLDSLERHPALVDQQSASRLARTLDADLLARAVRQLTPEQQQVILLRFAEGLDTPRIASILDKHESAVRALQARALQRLRRILSAEDGGTTTP
jgi:RNA polymerase sigma-70 factor (ECF subfamily)